MKRVTDCANCPAPLEEDAPVFLNELLPHLWFCSRSCRDTYLRDSNAESTVEAIEIWFSNREKIETRPPLVTIPVCGSASLPEAVDLATEILRVTSSIDSVEIRSELILLATVDRSTS